MSLEERFNLERRYHDQEGHVARLAGRLKFACCPICGSVDGMDAVHRETMALLSMKLITMLAPWYSAASSCANHRFHACDRCNRQGTIPAGFVRMRVADIPAWLDDDTDPMAPDYAVLVDEPEPVLASIDSRKSAGLEG